MTAPGERRDTLKSLSAEAAREGARRLAGKKSPRAHAAYLAQLDRRLAAIGHTYLDLMHYQMPTDGAAS